jgi:integrase/recombinase XerD
MSFQASRLTLPLSDWPVQHLAPWQVATTDANPFRKRVRAADWKHDRRRKIEEAYGQYLAWLSKNDLLNPNLSPAQLITRELLEEYVQYLNGRVAPVTVAINICYITAMMEAIEPTEDWRWLGRVGQHLKGTAQSKRDKRRAVVPAKDLFDLGVHLMRQADTSETCTLSAAIRFRDGLLISFLAALPLRLSNFSSIELDKHLIYRSGVYWLYFSAEETKTERPIEGRIPDCLSFWLERYLRIYRPLLASETKPPTSMALWLSQQEEKMSKGAIRERIEHHTRKAFGHAIWPHLFRDCVATSIATEDPEHVRLIADIFGHATRATAEKYYIQSNSLVAGRKYQSIIKTIRRGALDARLSDDGSTETID